MLADNNAWLPARWHTEPKTAVSSNWSIYIVMSCRKQHTIYHRYVPWPANVRERKIRYWGSTFWRVRELISALVVLFVNAKGNLKKIVNNFNKWLSFLSSSRPAEDELYYSNKKRNLSMLRNALFTMVGLEDADHICALVWLTGWLCLSACLLFQCSCI